MIKKKFKVNEIEELLYGDSDSLNNISDSIIDSDHWYIQHEIIFQEKESEKYYSVYYDESATDGESWFIRAGSDNNVECVEVVPVQVTVTQYKIKE
jgi:hypothetical protein